MLQQDKPKDYVIATGIQYSVREFVMAAAKELDINLHWEGSGLEEKAYLIDSSEPNGKRLVVAVDPRYFRPTEVETLLGDASKARLELKWSPRISFEELVREMAREDLITAKRDELVNAHGYKTFGAQE
jgi:GDPmannose 4,6-dehydratase